MQEREVTLLVGVSNHIRTWLHWIKSWVEPLFCLRVLFLLETTLKAHIKIPQYMISIFRSWSSWCVKSVQIRSYFWSLFSCIQSEYRKIRTRNNSVFWHFSRSLLVYSNLKSKILFKSIGYILLKILLYSETRFGGYNFFR